MSTANNVVGTWILLPIEQSVTEGYREQHDLDCDKIRDAFSGSSGSGNSSIMDGLEKMWNDLNWFGLRRLFYLVGPEETRFENACDVPNYFDQATPWFITLVIIEFTVLQIQGKHSSYALNDTMTSTMAGVFSLLSKLFIRGLGLILYSHIFDNYKLIELPADSVLTWLFCFVTQDLAYYLMHRATHEVSFMWAFHQMHHSSEYYNFSTALRQGGIQELASMCFESVQALAIPPSVYIIHRYLNILYQFWIHTEVIPKLGVLEYVINTPSHHRVHHGRNPYCIDKNYGGTLIIWDRLLGTFAEEKDNEQIAYGLVHNVNSFDQLYCQAFAFKELMFDKPWKWVKGSSWDSLKAYVLPPGWFPGSKLKWFIWWRMADTEEGIPKIEYPVEPYNPPVAVWIRAYGFVHLARHILDYQEFQLNVQTMTSIEICIAVFFMILTMQSLGAIFDKKPYAPYLESSRCVLALIMACATKTKMVLMTDIVSYAISLTLWIGYEFGNQFQQIVLNGDIANKKH